MIKITQFFNATSQAAQHMRYDFEHAHGTVYSRYTHASQARIRAWNDIIQMYCEDAGVQTVMIKGVKHTIQYQHDCKVAGASSHFFSTIASFEDVDTGEIYLIKETHCNRYMCNL